MNESEVFCVFVLMVYIFLPIILKLLIFIVIYFCYQYNIAGCEYMDTQ